ncbi:hypothetical protein EGW08_019778 [Elysia chlorotica]|uniref:Serine/threonine-protein kinase 11-interacting protein n=1 Tax=Elysia chlorotica TaxID=188477 RepID=A0A3S1B5G6_ELYCH|nr:hypothetical protein EGW08_019778 [Elysia chlorotica]
MASGTSPPSGLLSLVSASPTSYGSTSTNRHSEPSGIGITGLRRLCNLLRNEGDRVLSGQSVFTLTSDVLSHLLVSCRRHSVILTEQASAAPDPSVRTPTFVTNRRVETGIIAGSRQDDWNTHIQFIKDFMLSTPNLKVVHNQGTLSFPISLHRFGNINKLELRRIPIHMVEGLQMHRQSLESLAVFRGVSTVKDLVESCGGDRSAPLTWPRLKALSLMFNTIPDLDDSLRLLPHVEYLDLSHNCLEKCDVYLEELKTSQYFSIENLTVLEELDLGENCISDHSFLEPLVYLTRLGQLLLDGNPLFYHRRHRRLTASCLSAQALSLEFELDKRKLTVSEIIYYAPRNRRSNFHKPAARPSNQTSPQRSSTPERRPSFSSGIGTELESSDIVVRSPRKSKRKRLKPRETEIHETSGDFTSSRDASPGTTPHYSELMRLRTEEALRTKEQVEELRRNYGPNWLQAIEDKNIFNKNELDTPAQPLSEDEVKSDDDDNNTIAIATGKKSKNSKAKKKEKENSLRKKNISPLASEPASKTDTGDDESVGKSGEDNPPVAAVVAESDTCPSDSDVLPGSKRVEKVKVANPIMAALARLAAQQSEGEISAEPGTEYGFVTNSSVETSEFVARKDNFESQSSKPSVAPSTQAEDVAVSSSTPASKLAQQIEALSPVKSTDEADSSILKTSLDEHRDPWGFRWLS